MPSDKVKSKDLSYDNSLPPFLQRLHAQKAGLGDQDRHERPVARPKRAKAYEEEDEPTVVDESGETVSKADLEKMTANPDLQTDDDGGNVTGKLDDPGEALAAGALQDQATVPRSDQKVTDGTATKKRKVAKVVGGENDAPNQEDTATTKDEDESRAKKATKKTMKKMKPIKLAFDDADEN
jgi:hypothetical protein